MAIDKVVNQAPNTSIEIDQEGFPEIEILLEDDGSAVVEIDDEEDEVEFYANLAEVIDEDDLNRMSIDLQAMFDADKASRADWEMVYAKGLELLGLKLEERTKPFRGAAGAVHPMLTEAIVQFQSQAMKELMPPDGPVRTRVMGKETVDKMMQASRVQDFMNYELTTVMEEYTPEMDQSLFYLGYGGSVFKKVYFDEQKDRMVSKLCLADDVYIPYNGSSVMSQCPRITHRVSMDANSFRKRVVAGEYLDLDIQPEISSSEGDQIQEGVDRQTGLTPSDQAEEVFLLEFQVDYDIPGFEDTDEDGEPTGIKLPYVVTLDETSGKVLGVRRNWKEGDELKRRRDYFVHYVLIEGLGAYGLGFVHLIGSLSKTATAALRQLLDAGTLSNLPAGFKAKGARIADSDTPIQPGEWRDIDAIHKRLHYAQKLEFQLLARGFGEYLPDEYPYDVPGASRKIKKADFNDMVAVLPVADPNIFSTAQRITLAQTQLQMAQTAPQMHNMYEAYYRVYTSLNVRDIDGILRPQSSQFPKDPATENADVLDSMELKAFAGQQHDAHIEAHLRMGISPLLQANPMSAAILQKHILQPVRIKAEEDVEVELFKAYGTDPDKMVSAIQKEGMVALKVAQGMADVKKMQDEIMGTGQPPADPIVELKKQELDQRAKADAADAANDEKKIALQQAKLQQDAQDDQARIASQDAIADERADIARERLDIMEQQMLQQNQGDNNAS
jgi:hypothetical protein